MGLILGTVPVSFGAPKYNEAPMLAELVKAGKLPPGEERLPKEPYVVGPGVLIRKEHLDWEVGQYGGTIRMVHFRPFWDGDTYFFNLEHLLGSPELDERDWRGDILKDFKVSRDNKTFTFYMREGLKWSDGHPVTTEDIRFTWEDVLLNEKITPVFPVWLRSGGMGTSKPMKLEIISPYTFRLISETPYGRFILMLGLGDKGYTDILKPSHLLKQFHVKYTPLEKLEPLIKKEGFPEGAWWSLFLLKEVNRFEIASPQAIGFPVLNPWMLVSQEKGLSIFERNPYYWKVDTAGNQLPYIDRIRLELVSDVEMLHLKVLGGEVDYLREQTSMEKLPLYKTNEEKGGYRTLICPMPHPPTILFLNLAHKDPVWRKVVGDVRFRRALNMGINRKEIIDMVYYGFGSLPKEREPIIYDVVKANKNLDEMGLGKRDKDGYRLGPDGKRFTIPIEIQAATTDIVKVSELLIEYGRALGLYVTVKTIESGLFTQRSNANEIKATVIWGAAPWDDPLQWKQVSLGWWYNWWITEGKTGEEPPLWAKAMFKLCDQRFTVLPGSEEEQRIVKKIFSSEYEYLPYMIMAVRVGSPVIVSKRLGNIPSEEVLQAVSNITAEQFFFRR